MLLPQIFPETLELAFTRSVFGEGISVSQKLVACLPFSFLALHGNCARFVQPCGKHNLEPISLPSKGIVNMHQPTTDDAGARQSLLFWGGSIVVFPCVRGTVNDIKAFKSVNSCDTKEAYV